MALLKWLDRNYIIKLSKFYPSRTQVIINYLNSLTFGIRTPVQKNVHCNLRNTLVLCTICEFNVGGIQVWFLLKLVQTTVIRVTSSLSEYCNSVPSCMHVHYFPCTTTYESCRNKMWFFNLLDSHYTGKLFMLYIFITIQCNTGAALHMFTQITPIMLSKLP